MEKRGKVECEEEEENMFFHGNEVKIVKFSEIFEIAEAGDD